ncbi:MAG: ATP-dependent helicase [Nitrospiraceae bacterium]|jgi:DNA helicase II / ATP-dependent DNA helicase PcrA|nr:MAG: ATP-dependent helicase [Nitrospiraceae bacterium]
MKKYFIHRVPAELKVDYEHELNPEQYAAVMHQEGPALVLAGAGTGKTRVVTYRVARLIESGIRAENILLLTFTNKAAKEMMRRVELLIGRNIAGLFGGTFHHVANLLLRQHYQLAGYKQGFSILDREDSKELFESCIAEIFKKDRVIPKGAVLSEICSLAKNTGAGVEDVVLQRFPHFTAAFEDIAKIVELYEKKKLALNLMDFDDLLVNWKKIFQENERIREYYSLKFRHILVDEYQDTNSLQADIIDLITGEAGNLMIVGDDAQSIYSFRGADFENILRFPDKYQGAPIYKLTINYRSTPEILHLANSIIVNNRKQFHKELHAVAASGESPFVVPLKDIFEQAEFVASVVIDMNMDGKSFDEIAVLYRSHYQSMELQMEFQRRGIPFEVRSGLKFFEQAHIKDMLSFLKVLSNQHDEISWKRILKLIPGIGNITAAKIWNLIQPVEKPLGRISEASGLVPKKAAEGFNLFVDILGELSSGNYNAAPAEAIGYVLGHGYEDHLYNTYPNAEMRIEDIEQMMKFALRYDSMEMFLADMTLQGVSEAEAEGEDITGGRVVLSTVHQAKGLEWDNVFLIGLNDGKFPSAKSLKNGDEEEERRLFYVGVTRAREAIYLCYPVTSDDWHSMGMIRPSRFISELPPDCFDEIAVEDI